MRRRTSLRPILFRLPAAGLLVACAACATAERAVDETLVATSQGIDATGNALALAGLTLYDWIPFVPPHQGGFEEKKALMAKQVGPEHFANKQFRDGRDDLHLQPDNFTKTRDKLVNQPFVDSRDQLRGTKYLPEPGLVLGPTVVRMAILRDPTLARAALLAATSGASSVFVPQPVLAALLPGWGY